MFWTRSDGRPGWLLCVIGVMSLMLRCSHCLARPTPLSTAFTYQGELKFGGNLINNTADFQFTLFDAISAGNQIGSISPVNNLTLVAGRFTATLDFGTSAFDGNERFLQIAVRSPAGSGSFTTLTPRQRVAATPYALETRGITVDANNNVGIGTTNPFFRLHVASVADPAMVLQDTGPGSTQTGFISFRNDAGTETGWFGYGTAGSPHMSVVNARTGGDLAFLTETSERLTISSNGNVGIGTTSPGIKLDVRGDIRLGPTGELRATSGEENLRIIRGRVSLNGSPAGGSGFSSVRTSQGHYSITFDTPFLSPPCVTATAHNAFAGDVNCYAVSINGFDAADSVSLQVNLVGGGPEDRTIDFIAIGTR